MFHTARVKAKQMATDGKMTTVEFAIVSMSPDIAVKRGKCIIIELEGERKPEDFDGERLMSFESYTDDGRLRIKGVRLVGKVHVYKDDGKPEQSPEFKNFQKTMESVPIMKSVPDCAYCNNGKALALDEPCAICNRVNEDGQIKVM